MSQQGSFETTRMYVDSREEKSALVKGSEDGVPHHGSSAKSAVAVDWIVQLVNYIM